MAAKPFLFFLSLLPSLFSLLHAAPHPDAGPLLAFKATSDASNLLATWNTTSSDPCNFAGVSCTRNRVSRLVLENLNLRGSFAELTGLTQLRVLSLKRNRLSGPIPDLSNLTSLKLLFLSHNDFSGEFPSSLTSLFRLYRLDLAYNNLTGEVPETVNRLTHLLTLRLEANRFTGSISGLNFPSLQEFNVSANQISGEIPKSLSIFSESAFAENPGLCGAPVQNCKTVTDPTRPGGAIASPVMPAGSPTVVSSSPTSLPSSSTNSGKSTSHHNGGSKLTPAALIGIIVGDVAVLLMVSLFLYCYFWRKFKTRQGKSSSKLLETEKIVYSSSPYSGQPTFERGQMVFFEGVRRFELEDLLRASAEMLGKGGFGTAYKAVLDDGNVVAVKRLKDAQIGGKSQFEQHMAVLGKLNHGNVVSLRAYYFAREEKLLVYDYMPNGSLFWLLHGSVVPLLFLARISGLLVAVLVLIWTFSFRSSFHHHSTDESFPQQDQGITYSISSSSFVHGHWLYSHQWRRKCQKRENRTSRRRCSWSCGSCTSCCLLLQEKVIVLLDEQIS